MYAQDTGRPKVLVLPLTTDLDLLRGLSYHDLGNSLDYSDNEKADVESLIEEGKMILSRADQALDLYGIAVSDLSPGTGQYSKNAQQFITRIGEFKARVEQIKKKINYLEKTK